MATEVKVGTDTAVQNLLILKDMTRRTGMLHDLQVKQLQMWPLAILDAKESTCKFGFEQKVVKFEITGFKDGEPANLQERIAHLRACVEFLLGKNYKVSVWMDKKRLDAGHKADRKAAGGRTKGTRGVARKQEP